MIDETHIASRAIVGAEYWLQCSPHEQTHEDAMAMAAFVRVVGSRHWRPVAGMPRDGTPCLVTNGTHVEIRSQRDGRGGSDGQPIAGHGLSWDHWPRPTAYMPLSALLDAST